jgi:8-oxo-dGTP pyrophosphatase MutT (NUDIX family)
MASSATRGRVLVHLRTGAGLKPSKFSECVLTVLDPDTAASGRNTVNVNCRLKGGNLELTADNRGFPLVHPPECPMTEMLGHPDTKIPEDILSRGVAVGVVAVVESSDHRVLLTRRAKHMRTFPGVWVPPGGGVEPGEVNLIDTAVRELEEETGLKVTEKDVSGSKILGLWESVYPPFFSLGSPKRHHVVVYYHVPIDKSSSELNSEIVLQQEEVDASAWLSVDHAKLVTNGEASDADTTDPFVMKVLVDGEQKDVVVPPDVLRAKAPKSGVDVERVSSGTRFALMQWLKENVDVGAKL